VTVKVSGASTSAASSASAAVFTSLAGVTVLADAIVGGLSAVVVGASVAVTESYV
jgi:hypothetical protein